jgi:stage II sporulation protein R
MSKAVIMLKSLGTMQRAGNIFKVGITLLVTAAVVAGMFLGSYSENVNRDLADNLIRLHVIANSDSPSDQALKRNVRDVILAYMNEQLKDSKDINRTKSIINEKMTEINRLAVEELKKNGSDYSVKSSLGSYPFPTKSYGDITLPAGNYQALRIVIGKGEGANWWCVLFPPLCFVDVTHGTIPDPVKNELKTALTDEEYSIVTSADADSEIPVRIKFKVVEFFQDSSIKFAGLISKIFASSK